MPSDQLLARVVTVKGTPGIFQCGLRACLGEADRVVDHRRDLGAHGLDVGGIEAIKGLALWRRRRRVAGGRRLWLTGGRILDLGDAQHPRKRVIAHIGLDLGGHALGPGIGHRMAAEAIGLEFDEAPATLVANGIERPPGHGVDRQDIHAIGLLGGHCISARAPVNVGDRRMAANLAADLIAVVFTNSQHGNPPKGSHVLIFMESTMVRRAVSEKADDRLGQLAVGDGIADAERNREALADDRVPSHEAAFAVKDVHGAPMP